MIKVLLLLLLRVGSLILSINLRPKVNWNLTSFLLSPFQPFNFTVTSPSVSSTYNVAGIAPISQQVNRSTIICNLSSHDNFKHFNSVVYLQELRAVSFQVQVPAKSFHGFHQVQLYQDVGVVTNRPIDSQDLTQVQSSNRFSRLDPSLLFDISVPSNIHSLILRIFIHRIPFVKYSFIESTHWIFIHRIPFIEYSFIWF